MSDGHLAATLSIPGVSESISIERVRGRESISRLFEYRLELVCDGELEPDAALAGDVELVFGRDGALERRLHGRLCELRRVIDARASGFAYTALFVPALWDASLSYRTDVYVDLTLPQIVEAVLARSGVQPVELRLHGDYPVHELVIQYRESDLDFLRRITQRRGVYFFFEPDEERTKLVFADHNGAIADVTVGSHTALPLTPFGGEGSTQPNSVLQLEHVTRTVPHAHRLIDYNYRTPQLDLGVEAVVSGVGRGRVVEDGAHYKDQNEGHALLGVRIEETLARRSTYSGTGNAVALRAGGTFTVEGGPEPLHLIVTELELDFERRGGTTLRFSALARDVCYRPPRDAPVPHIGGFVTGIVEGLLGEGDADIDDEGRYRVRFLFDATDKQQAQASRPVRMMQPHAGPGYGMHFPLKPGAEVLIAFVNGDPDRPVIAGSMPNPSQPTPVGRNDHTKNRIRTVSGVLIEIDDRV